MTVRELIERLQEYPPDYEVLVDEEAIALFGGDSHYGVPEPRRCERPGTVLL